MDVMAADLSKIGVLTRREIEARISVPLINAFIRELGQEKTKNIVREVIESLAREAGAQLKEQAGGNSLAHFMEATALWREDDAYEEELLEQTEKKLSYNITRCRYAEMYKEIGYGELGFYLSCSRDFALIEGFNPKISLTRTQTIMEGADYCDFRYELED